LINAVNYTKDTLAKELTDTKQYLLSSEIKRKRGRPRKEEVIANDVDISPKLPAMELRIRKGTKKDDLSDKRSDSEVVGKPIHLQKLCKNTGIDGLTDNRN